MLVEHFVQGGACPNFFYHKEKSDRCNVHGDDFTSVGPRNSLDWFEAYGREVRGQRPPSAWTRQDEREGGQCEEPDRQVVRQLLGFVLYEADLR